MFEIVKMTHVCQYWRSTLISYPHLWSSNFVKNDHKDFVAACLERSREVPLAVCLDLKHSDYDHYPDCTCIRKDWSSGTWVNERHPCRYHTTIRPLLDDVHLKRVHTLDVHLTLLDENGEDDPDEGFRNALNDLGLLVLPLPVLESLSFRVDHAFDDVETHLEFPKGLFFWGFSPPTELRHLTLHGCYGGPIPTIRNLTSFKLAGVLDSFGPIVLDQDTFLPFISGNPSLVSLSLSHCSFPDRAELSRVAPIQLPELKSLRLIGIEELSSFSGLVHVPALKRLSSLRISTRRDPINSYADILVRAESGDGFQLSYDAPNCREMASGWLGVTDDADPSPAFVCFERQELGRLREGGVGASPLVLFSGASVLEISASFASPWYRDFWGDLGKVGPQLTTLRLEVVEGMEPGVATSAEKFVRARFNGGTPLTKLERMTFEDMSEEDEEKAKQLWEEFRASLSIDQYLAIQ